MEVNLLRVPHFMSADVERKIESRFISGTRLFYQNQNRSNTEPVNDYILNDSISPSMDEINNSGYI